MNTESQQQLARKTAAEFFMLLRNWTGFDAKSYHQKRLEGIILSAIEQAHQNGWHEGRNYEAKFGVKPERRRAKIKQ